MSPGGGGVAGTQGQAEKHGQYIAKLRAPVRLTQPGQSPVDGYVMLSPETETDARPETLHELLNAGRTVIPFIPEHDDQVLLLMRTNIDWVTVGKDADTRLIFPPSYQVSHGQHVQLTFMDAGPIDVLVQWKRRDKWDRLSDYLNRCDEFFPVVANFGTLFVNRRRIRQMRISEPKSDPISG